MAFFVGSPDGRSGGHDHLAQQIAEQGKKFGEEHWRWEDMQAYVSYYEHKESRRQGLTSHCFGRRSVYSSSTHDSCKTTETDGLSTCQALIRIHPMTTTCTASIRILDRAADEKNRTENRLVSLMTFPGVSSPPQAIAR